MKKVVLSLILIVMLLVACDSGLDAPDVSGGDGIDIELPDIGVDGEPGGIEASVEEFLSLYEWNTDQIKEFGLTYTYISSGGNLMLPEYRAIYETEYDLIVNEYFNALDQLNSIRDSISAEEYYTRYNEIQNDNTRENAILTAKWNQLPVYEPVLFYAQISNSSGEDRILQAGYYYQGTIYSSQIITVPANSNKLYELRVDTDGYRLGSSSFGIRVE